MSEAIDKRVDNLRDRLVRQSSQPINMGNARQQMRAYQEMMLELINIMDAVNAGADEIGSSVLETLRKSVSEVLAKSEGET